MFLQIFFSVTLSYLAFLSIEAKVIETRHIENISHLIDQDTWLLVDLDNCLFEGTQALGHANWFYDQLQQRMQKGMTKEEAIRDIYPSWIKTQKVCKVKPLESEFVPLLHELQDKGMVVMALTHRQPAVADCTIKQVASLDFDFLKTAPSKEYFTLPARTPALYLQGILFAGDYNKKIDIFKQFLSRINQKPKKVIFIDDKRRNVEELEVLVDDGIEYIGVYYTAIEHAQPVYSRKIAEFQAKFLDQILSNEAAILLLQNGLE